MKSLRDARVKGVGGMRRLGATVLGLAGLLFGAASCNQIGGIHEGVPRGDDPVVPCSAVEDCAKVEAPECRVPVACDRGLCGYGNVIEGTPAKAQVPGDCTDVVCDGAGKTQLFPRETDVPDDGNICTLDTCAGTTPVHSIQTELPCYTGPGGTKGKGICVEGTQHCDAQGNVIGGCEGEVLPAAETCISPLDEDCDGKANEEGQGCECVPGAFMPCYTGPGGTQGVGVCHSGMQSCNGDGLTYGPCVGEQKPKAETCDAGKADDDCDGEVNEEGADCTCGDGYVSAGEECDDGNLDSTDSCTELCKVAVCGDGFVFAGVEACDDSNADSTDDCTVLCKTAVCGDDFVQPSLGETCDDGGMSDGDPCSPTCNEQKVLLVVAGHFHTCAFLSGDSVKCWGRNSDGQLGLGDINHRGDGPNEMGDNLPVINLGTGKTAAAITLGSFHTCALLNDGSVKCWGRNSDGQLGLGDTSYRGDGSSEMGDNLPAVDLGTGTTASAIVAGGYHTCALLNDGSVKCWGRNAYGQLGLGDLNNRGDGSNEMGNNLPTVNLGTGETASALIAGFSHTCALLNGGGVKCWGFNVYGQLGMGDTIWRGDGPGEMGNSLPTVDLGSGSTASAVGAGGFHTCALLNDASVKCWGRNNDGQLGLDNTNDRGNDPNEMGDNLLAINLGTGKAVSVMSVGGEHACALLNDSGVKCWGNNAQGQLGLGDTNNRGDGPNEMDDNLPAVNLGMSMTASAIDAGGFHTCALLNDGSIKCWGSNGYGQLGLGPILACGDEPNEMGDNLPRVKLFSDFW